MKKYITYEMVKEEYPELYEFMEKEGAIYNYNLDKIPDDAPECLFYCAKMRIDRHIRQYDYFLYKSKLHSNEFRHPKDICKISVDDPFDVALRNSDLLWCSKYRRD